MFMFNYGYSESSAMIIALSVLLIIGIIGLGFIIYEFFKDSWQINKDVLYYLYNQMKGNDTNERN